MAKGNKCSNGVSGNMPAFQAGVVSSNLVYCTNIGENWYSILSHKQNYVCSIHTPETIIQEKMKTVDAIFSDTLVGILDKLNDLKVPREDVVNIFQNTEGQYVAIFYS